MEVAPPNEGAPAEAAPLPPAATSALPPEPPDAFNCPITTELMNDPVVAFDGHTYERLAIEHWFERRRTSPKTGEALENTLLLPNHTIRSQIVEWRERHEQDEDK